MDVLYKDDPAGCFSSIGDRYTAKEEEEEEEKRGAEYIPFG